jgi:hypothetical protein
MNDYLSPRDALAAAIGGIPLGRDSIRVGDTVVWASPLGVVRVGRRPIGLWNDGADTLAARYYALVAA